MISEKLAQRQDHIGALSGRLVDGRDFSSGRELRLAKGASQHDFSVLHNGISRKVRIADNGKRPNGSIPPDPDAAWLDELLTAACRILFGSSRGSCRKVQGSDQFEFRDFWPEPTRYKVVEGVRCEVVRDGETIKDENIIISTAAYPGADVRSVVFSSAFRLCRIKFGVGMLEWIPGKDHRVRFTVGKNPGFGELIEAQYVIHRKGGISNEITVHLTPEQSRDWKAIRGVVEIECRKKYGTGTVTYMPELGEVSFEFKWRG